MSEIGFGGLSSGIDTNTLVEKLLQIERRPISKLQARAAKNNTAVDRLRLLNTRLSAMATAASKLMGVGGLNASPIAARTATLSADPPVLTMAMSPGTTTGSHSITVNNLAKAAKLTAGATNPGTLVSGGGSDATTFTISLTNTATSTTTTATFEATGSDTYSSVAAKINSQSTSPVSASVVGNKLVLTSKTLGANQEISVAATVLNSGPTLENLGLDTTAGVPATTTAGEDASITVDGTTLTGTSNTFTNAISGATITLLKPGSTTAEITPDTNTALTAMKDLLARYNEVITQLREDTKFDATTQKAGPLRLTTGVRDISLTLSRLVTDQFAPAGGNGTFDSYKDLGLSLNRDGTLALDETVFTDAVKFNPGAVHKLLSNEDGVTGAGSARSVDGAGDGIANRLRAVASALADTGSPWNALGPNGARLQGNVLANITSLTTSTTTINTRIGQEQIRVSRRETLLRIQFQNMEKTISALKTQGSYLSNQFANLSGGGAG